MNRRSIARVSFLFAPLGILIALWLSPNGLTHFVAPALADPNYPWNSDPDGFPGYLPTGGPDDDEDKDPTDSDYPFDSPPDPLSLTHWTPIGPAPIVNGSIPGGRPTSGRCGQVAAHPTDPNTLYLATVGGGIWKTTDGGTNWTPLTDNQATLWGYAVAVSQSDPNTIYAGTGEPTNSITSFYGRGILKSTDAGATWTLLGSGVFNRRSISRVVIHPTDPDTVYVTTGNGVNSLNGNRGVWKTTNGGLNWVNTSSPSVTPAQFNGNYSDLLMDPTDPNTLYCAVGQYSGFISNGVYKTTDGGTTWAVAGNHPKGIANGVISIAISKSNHLVLYSITSNPSTSGLLRLMKTTDGGVTWNQVTGVPNFMGGQGWYDQDIAVDPGNENVVYVGGQSGANGILKTEDGGTTWNPINQGVDGHGPHVDHHGMAFDALGRLLEVNDGGIWRLNDAALPTLTWADLNGNLQITQFIGIANHPTDATIAYGGSQDNGSEACNNDIGWVTIRGGDGGFFRVDPATPATLYHTFFYPASGGFLERSDDAGAHWASKISGINTADTGNFYVPYVIDPSNPTRLLLGTNRVYETTNRGDSWTAISAPNTNGWVVGTVDAVSAAPSNVDTIWATASGSIYVTFNHGATWNQRNSNTPGDHFHDIVVDPTDNMTAYVVRDRFGLNKVFRTSDGGVTWNSINGDLPDIPAQSFALAINNPGQADDTYYIGTDTGVYRSTNGGVNWTVWAAGMPNVSVMNMDLRRSLGALMAGTHGRGAFKILVPTPPSMSALANQVALCGSTYTGPLPVVTGTAPITFSLLANPAGMTIDASSGIVTWPNPVPSLTDYNVTIKAANDGGGFDTKSFTLRVRPGDFNGDGIADTADLPTFVNHLLGLDNSRPCAADTNNDGFVDGLDAQGWVISSLTP